MKLNQNQEKEICLLYNNGVNGYELAKIFNISPVTIYRIIRKYGFEVRNMSKAKTKYKIDESLFDVINFVKLNHFTNL